MRKDIETAQIKQFGGENVKDEPQIKKLHPNESQKKDAKRQKLLQSSLSIMEAAGKSIVFSSPWVKIGEVPIIAKGTINLIQGKTGAHKSRLAEGFSALLLGHGVKEYAGFEKNGLGVGYCVTYIDTERNTQEDFPAAVQRIRELAGYERTENTRNFYPVSIKGFSREERLDATREWIEYVREDMKTRGLEDWHLFVVLDVITDCVRSFNNDADTLALFDYIGNLTEEYGVSFLLILHENPGSEKARGHTGTEGANKANTQLQIGFERDANGEETELIKVRFLKTRNAARPSPLYLQYSKAIRGLVLADPDLIAQVTGPKQKRGDIESIIEILEPVFDMHPSLTKKEVLDYLTNAGIAERTAERRLKEILEIGTELKTNEGKPAKLRADVMPGKPTIYSLETIEQPYEKDEGLPF